MSATGAAQDGPVDIGAFCRDVEAHLCRVNGGHLVRIVGPSFELVARWAREGVPLRVVEHGVERTVARLTARGPRRRPVRIEFCEHDVRDAYQQWRRAVGVHVRVHATSSHPEEPFSADPVSTSKAPPLPRHIERVLLRLSSARATRELPPPLQQAIDEAIGRIDQALDASRGARGPARQAVVDQLREIEAALTLAAMVALPAADQQRLRAQTSDELVMYRSQLPADAYRAAEQALLGQLARRHFVLPQVGIDG
ncbi:MAG: hypothetical protein H0V80_12535 [Acidobacteria bacterium]|nr:hypothetical protein [Acidobacteriota bacterium]